MSLLCTVLRVDLKLDNSVFLLCASAILQQSVHTGWFRAVFPCSVAYVGDLVATQASEPFCLSCVLEWYGVGHHSGTWPRPQGKSR